MTSNKYYRINRNVSQKTSLVWKKNHSLSSPQRGEQRFKSFLGSCFAAHTQTQPLLYQSSHHLILLSPHWQRRWILNGSGRSNYLREIIMLLLETQVYIIFLCNNQILIQETSMSSCLRQWAVMFLLPCFMQKWLGERNLKNMTLHISPFLIAPSQF